MHVQLSNGKLLNLTYFEDAKQGFHDKKIVVIYLTNGTKFIERFATEEEAEQEAELIREAAKAGGGLLQKDSLSDLPKTGNSGTIYIAKDTGQTYYWDNVSKTYIKTGTAGRTGVYSYNKSLPSVVGTSIVAKKSELNEILKPTVDFSEGSEVIGNNAIHGIITNVNGDDVTITTITDLTIDSFRQVATLNDLPISGVDNILYYVQDVDEFRIWDSTNGKWVEPFHPVIFNNVPAIADARLNTLYIDGDIIKYTSDNITWVEISAGTAMSEYKSNKILSTIILGTTNLDLTDLDTTLTIDKLEEEQLVFDKNGTVAKIVAIDIVDNKLDVITITTAGGGNEGSVIASDFDYETGYSYTINNVGTGYVINDVISTDIAGQNVKVTSIGTNGEILTVAYTRNTIVNVSGTGADIKAISDPNVYIIPDSVWTSPITVFSLTNDDGASVEFIKIGDVTTKYNMGADSKYYKFEYDENEGIIVASYSEIKGSSDDAKLTEQIISNIACGAAPVNTKFAKDTSFTEFAKMILIKEIAPSISFSASGSGNKAIGTTVSSTTLTLTISSLGTGTPTSVDFYVGNTIVDTKPYVSGKLSYVYTYTGGINSTTIVKGKLNYTKSDGTTASYVEGSKSFTFVNPSYYGVTTIELNSLVDTDVNSLSSVLLTSKAYTYSSINSSDQYVVYAYPASYGLLSSIKDINGFDASGSFGHITLVINGVNYYVYETKNTATLSGYKYVFA